MKGAFHTGNYSNVFAELGYAQSEIDARLKEIVDTMFFGSEVDRLYHTEGDDMGYIVDTGNNDVRTEGVSYCMMMFLQLDMKEHFDRVWRWSLRNMYNTTGENRGYFAWHCELDGTKKSQGPAPDGEEFFAMALFFASNRWGDGEGELEYSKWARTILHDCVHKGEQPGDGQPMWNPQNKLIKFVPNVEFTDPSYHLPHFYELFALWANEGDRKFWKEAADASRAYMKLACHPVTGLAPEYAEYDGTPSARDERRLYYSDSYRVPANIGLCYEWFAADEWEVDCCDRVQKFFFETARGKDDLVYEIDGTIIDRKALHPVAIIATNAMASLAAQGKYREEAVRKFWETPLRTGDRRYYDNCLYLFAFLALSGNYRIYMPR